MTQVKEDEEGYVSHNLALLYYNGDGVEQSYPKAIDYFIKAAQKNLGAAQFMLGVMCYNGEGVKKDIYKAKEWLQTSLANGYDAELMLNIVLAELEGLPQDVYMKKYADHLLEKNLTSKELYDKVVEDLQEDFGATWGKLKADSHAFLATGMVSYLSFYNMGEEIYKTLDFSSAILPMCKALEGELGEYLYTGYIKYLVEQNIDPYQVPESQCVTREEKNGDIVYCSDLRDFKVGGLKYLFGLKKYRDYNGTMRISADPIYLRYFRSICKKDAFPGLNNEKLMVDYLNDLNESTFALFKGFRNKAAHADRMNCEQAIICGGELIKVKKMIRKFMEELDI